MTKIAQATKLIESQRGTNKIFYVEFVKKDGTFREMKCRFDVKKHLKGGELAFDPEEKGLFVVFDMDSGGYRMINKTTIKKVKAEGQEIIID